MKVFFEMKKIDNLSLALGFFDGIHIGHQVVIHNTSTFAKIKNSKSAVITFKEHPKSILNNNNIKTIIDNETKINLISNLQINYVFLLDFNKFKELSAIDYLGLLVKYFSPIAITTGFNYYFGYKKSGNTELLASMRDKYNYNYFEIGAIKHNNTVISSTLIRKLIAEKKYNEVQILLGHCHYNK